MFVNWTGFYYNHFIAAMDEDRPPQDIIDKDALLDEWLEEQRFQKKNAHKSSIKGASQHAESFEAM